MNVATPAEIGHNSQAYSNEEYEDVVKSVASSLAEVMVLEDKTSRAKASADETKANAYGQAHALFESFALDREAKATEYKKNGLYNETQRDICDLLSKKVKDPVKTSKRGDSIYTDRIKKAWSRIVTAYRQSNEGTQSEADVKAKQTMALKNKQNARKAAVFDVLVEALNDPDASNEAIQAIHDRCLALANEINVQ
jgi:hypothetical protein